MRLSAVRLDPGVYQVSVYEGDGDTPVHAQQVTVGRATP